MAPSNEERIQMRYKMLVTDIRETERMFNSIQWTIKQSPSYLKDTHSFIKEFAKIIPSIKKVLSVELKCFREFLKVNNDDYGYYSFGTTSLFHDTRIELLNELSTIEDAINRFQLSFQTDYDRIFNDLIQSFSKFHLEKINTGGLFRDENNLDKAYSKAERQFSSICYINRKVEQLKKIPSLEPFSAFKSYVFKYHRYLKAIIEYDEKAKSRNLGAYPMDRIKWERLAKQFLASNKTAINLAYQSYDDLKKLGSNSSIWNDFFSHQHHLGDLYQSPYPTKGPQATTSSTQPQKKKGGCGSLIAAILILIAAGAILVETGTIAF